MLKRTCSLAVLAAALAMAGPGQVAAEPLTPTDRADINRRDAQYAAQAAIAPAPIFSTGSYPPPETDFVALSMQIERLAAYLREQAEANAGQAPAAVPGLDLPVPGSGVARHYGPDGPTVRSVSALLEYRLMLAGNPALKVGPVTDEGDRIRARIMGAGDALMDEYLVEKSSGVWTQVR
ncbi:MAG: hypothetical protein AB7E69_11525 [Sphingomonadales bacterium]